VGLAVVLPTSIIIIIDLRKGDKTMKKNINKRYIFPAIFSPETGGYNVEFPDLPGAFTCGDDWEESLYMAKDCLETYIYDLDEIPSTSKPENLKPKKR
jgi:predicted RNase H-like HicB family nuclease